MRQAPGHFDGQLAFRALYVSQRAGLRRAPFFRLSLTTQCTMRTTFRPSRLLARLLALASITAPLAASAAQYTFQVSAPGLLVTEGAPAFALGASAISFGTVAPGASATRSLAVSNTGNVSLTAPAIATTGENFSAAHNCPPSLGVDSSCSVELTFSPAETKAYTGALSVAFANAGAQGATLEGTATMPGVAYLDDKNLSITSLAFAETSVGSNSEPMTVKIKNTGLADLVFTGTGVSVSAPFSLSSNTCASATVVPAATCQVTVTFSPTAGQGFNGALTVQTNAPAPTSLTLAGAGDASEVLQVVTGNSSLFTFVQKRGGAWVAAGYGADGQLGLNSPFNQFSFVPVPALAGATQVVASYGHAFARLPSGNWVAAGSNDAGQLGLGHTSSTYAFLPVPALDGASQVVSKGPFTFARLASGVWAATGRNSAGQLGLGGIGDAKNFTPVPGLASATRVVAGYDYAFAQLADGEWVGAGYNAWGQLGIGDLGNRSSFSRVPALSGAVELVAGSEHSFARMSDGTWVAAGYNAYGQLGIGGTTNQSAFVAVPALAGARKVAAGGHFTFAQFADGTWGSVGRNFEGQLGSGGGCCGYYTFSPLPALNGATTVVAGFNSSYARLGDGSWVGAGQNHYGQLGLAGTSNRTTFVPITP